MANKLDTCVDNIGAQLTSALVAADGSGTLKAVKREVVLPFGEPNTPVLGLVISSIRRADKIWIAEVVIMVAANKGNVSSDERVTELVAAIDAQLTTVKQSGSAGGSIDLPAWEFWYAAQNVGEHLQHVGALATLRVRVEEPLASGE